jgi:hypothetical protein
LVWRGYKSQKNPDEIRGCDKDGNPGTGSLDFITDCGKKRVKDSQEISSSEGSLLYERDPRMSRKSKF